MSNWASKYTTSLFGRRFGLQVLSSAESGGNSGAKDYLVGPEGLRVNVSTAETTGTNVSAYGVSHLPGTSVGSSSVYTLDPPVPGVEKIIKTSTQAAVYLKVGNSAERISSSQASTAPTTIKSSSLGGTYKLVGFSTAEWLGIGLTSGTSSQSGLHILSTST